MPYSAQHKQKTRERITEAGRVLFNRHGFEAVSIDMVMETVGLTRGGFYNHFASKEALYQAAVSSFLNGRGARWREEAQVDAARPGSGAATERMVSSYLSQEHLDDVDGQCPMIALPSDIARAGSEIQKAYQQLLEAMVGLFEQDLDDQADGLDGASGRETALAMAGLCIGGMVVARTLPDSSLAQELRQAALTTVRFMSDRSANR